MVSQGLEGFVELVTAFAGQQRDLVAALQEIVPTLQQNLDAIPEALSALNPETHSLGWIFALHTSLAAASDMNQGPGSPPDQACQFLRVCSPEAARVVPGLFVELARFAKEWVLRWGHPKRAILPLRTAIQSLQQTPEDLTPLHADLFQVCLLSKCYHAASPVLEEQIFNVASDTTGTTARDFMLYAYYGGMLWIGRKEYKKAADLLLHAITTPAAVVSAIAVAAYKKYVLVQLIIGAAKGVALPKSAPTIVNRHVKAECTHYQEFAQACSTRDMRAVDSIFHTHTAEFEADGNAGLVRLCIDSLRHRKIASLTHTHMTLSLQGIAVSCKLSSAAEAESEILRMVDDGEIFASINQRDGMVAFNEDPELYKSAQMASFWDERIQQSIALDTRLQATNDAVRSSRNFISRTASRASGVSRPVGDPLFDDTERHPFTPAYF